MKLTGYGYAMEYADSSPALSGWPGMRQAFETHGLPIPPVPRSLRPELQAFGPWNWGTRDCSPEIMYHLEPRLLKRLIAGDVPHLMAISHFGHGINSYAITYCLVYRGLALLVQEGWGGVYMNSQAQAASLAELFGHCQALIDRADAHPPGPGATRRLLCIESKLRGEAACGWVAVGQPLKDTSGRLVPDYDNPVEPGTAFTVAERLLADVPRNAPGEH
jgi:hypothetical protein